MFTTKMKLSRDDLILDILFMSLLVVPFINLVDVAWMFTFAVKEEWLQLHTPLPIKLLKDIIVILLIGVSLFSIPKISKTNLYALGSILFVLIAEVVFSYYQNSSLPLIAAGVRWLLPVFLFPLLSAFTISNENLLKFLKRYRIILILTLVLQVFQILFSERWGECSVDGCRASGFFAMPQPQAFFALFFIFFAREAENYKYRNYDYALAILTIFLTKSAAGFLGLAVFFFVIAPKKLKLISGVVSGLVIALFPFITGRGTFWKSPMIRLEILLENNFQLPHFGAYTNSCFNFKFINSFNDQACRVPDSFLTGIMGNLGLYAGILILGILSYLIIKSEKYLYLFILGIVLIGGSYTEYFPINIFFPLILGLHLKKTAS